MKKLLPLIIVFIMVFSFQISHGNSGSIKGIEYLHIPGYPILPYEVKTYVFNENVEIKKVSVKIKNLEWMEGKIKIAPYPHSIGNGKIIKYKEWPDRWYDYKVRMGLLNGKRVKILSVYLYPYRYKNGVILHADLNVSVKYEIEKIGKQLSNYTLLIITPSSLYQYASQLADFKNQHGIKTKVATLESIKVREKGRDLAEKIKYYIKDEIEKDGIKYVLLFGDADVLPVRYVKTGLDEPPQIPTDLYYADVFKGDGSFSSWDDNNNGIYGEKDDGMDLMPDVYVARLPASNGNDARILVNKIKYFELPRQRAIFIGTELFTDTDVSEGEYLKDYIADNVPQLKIDKLYESNGKANADTIANEINKGTMFVNFASHGSPDSIVWGTGSWSIGDLNLLHNEYRLPIVFAMSCLTNSFDTTDCLGEEFLLYPDGGALAYVGSTRVAYVYTGTAIKSSLAGYLDYVFFRSYYDGQNTTGSIFDGAIEYYLLHSPFRNALDRLTVMEFNMLGDPTVAIPTLPNTSRAYVKENIGSKIDVYATANYNGNATLYYKKEGSYKWIYYGTSSKPYHWVFKPPEEGVYELCSIVDGEEFPLHGDAYCIYDATPPKVEINSPQNGLYIFNKKILSFSKNVTISIGKIEISGKATDKFLKRVDIYANDEKIYSTSSSNFDFEWGGIKFGAYNIKVVAYDIADNMGEQTIKIIRII